MLATSAATPSARGGLPPGTYSWCLTAASSGAIAAIAVVGDEARHCVARLCAGAGLMAVAGIKRGTLTFHGQEIDDVLIVCRNERHFEIHAHGGVAVVERILEALRAAGAIVGTAEDYCDAVGGDTGERPASAPAILKEVLAALPAVDNSFTLRLLSGQHIQGLAEWARESLQSLTGGSPTDSLWRVQAQAQWILDRSDCLRHFLHPPRIALIGRPNAGKSTLLNALAGRDASITSDTAGTTRDWVDVTIRLSAGSVSLNAVIVDTAGLRTTDDHLEREAMARTHQQTQQADCVVVVLDGTSAGREQLEWIDAQADTRSGKLIYAINKIDISPPFAARKASENAREVYISALRGDGICDLQGAILESLGVLGCNPAVPMAWTPRQKRILDSLSMADAVVPAVLLLKDLLAPMPGGR